MPALTSNRTLFSEQGRAAVVGIVSDLNYLALGPWLQNYSGAAVHQTGTNSNQSDSESELETAKSVAQSRTTALYVLCSTVGMLVCLLLAACVRRQRRRMRDSEVHEAAREASRLARAELRANSLKPKIMSFRICVDGLEDGTCPICLDTLAVGGQVCAGDCGHPVHESCLFQWLVKDESMSCPVCRASFQILTSPPPDFEHCTYPSPDEENIQSGNQNCGNESCNQNRDEEAYRTNDGVIVNDHPVDENARQSLDQSHHRTEGDRFEQGESDKPCCACSHSPGESDVRNAG